MRFGKYRRVHVDENSRHADGDLRHDLVDTNNFAQGRTGNLRQEELHDLRNSGPCQSILSEVEPLGREIVAGSLELLRSVDNW